MLFICPSILWLKPNFWKVYFIDLVVSNECITCFVLVINHRCIFHSQIEFPTWASHLALTHLTLETLLFFSYNVLDDHSKYVCSKNSLIVKKVIQLLSWSLINRYIFCIDYLCMVWSSNTSFEILYERGKVLVNNKMAKMANFWKMSHFSQNGDFLKKVGTCHFSHCNFLEKSAIFWKKTRVFEKLKNRDFFQSIFRLTEKIATF